MKRGNKRIFGRQRQQRKAFIKSLLTALFSHGRIKTTLARAKTLKTEADKTITQAKRQSIASRRLLLRKVGAEVARKLSVEIAPRFADRKGGYTRVVRLGRRTNDAAETALIELV